MAVYQANKEYKRLNFIENPLQIGEYDNCSFLNCNFANSNLSEFVFTECIFSECNFSLSKIRNSAFKDVKFKDSKLLGLHFEDCNQFIFDVSFENCQLNLSSFYKINLKSILFIHCNLQEVDFSECNLTSAVFKECDLLGAVFENTNLEKSDFVSSYNFSINPEINRMKKAKFSLQTLSGLLTKYDLVIKKY